MQMKIFAGRTLTEVDAAGDGKNPLIVIKLSIVTKMAVNLLIHGAAECGCSGA
jgi:hypothetical protein